MLPQAENPPLYSKPHCPYPDFIQTYTELFARFEHDENARALLNDVAAELLAAFSNREPAPTSEEARAMGGMPFGMPAIGAIG